MIHVILPFTLAAVLAGAGVHAILARRNAVLMLVGVELVLAAANLVLVASSAVLPDRESAGQILAIFIITLAAAEVTLALGIILYAFRQRGHIDLTAALDADADAGLADGVHADDARSERDRDGAVLDADVLDGGTADTDASSAAAPEAESPHASAEKTTPAGADREETP